MKNLINIPTNTKLKITNNYITVIGPLGDLQLQLRDLSKISNNKKHTKKSLLKSQISLIKNLINGVYKGYIIQLKIVGIGYRASIKDNTLILKLGYSHEIMYDIPKDIKIFLTKSNKIIIFGLDKVKVTKIASLLRSYRTPDPYKGKGIRYINENIVLKEAKKKK